MHLVIDRLTLHVPGATERDARRLATLVAEGLVSDRTTSAEAHLDTVHLSVERPADGDPAGLAGRIVDRINDTVEAARC